MSLQRDRSLTISNIHTLLEGSHWKEADDLLQTDPNCAKRAGGTFNTLPLVTALMHTPPVWIVDSLIEKFPGAFDLKCILGVRCTACISYLMPSVISCDFFHDVTSPTVSDLLAVDMLTPPHRDRGSN